MENGEGSKSFKMQVTGRFCFMPQKDGDGLSKMAICSSLLLEDLSFKEERKVCRKPLSL